MYYIKRINNIVSTIANCEYGGFWVIFPNVGVTISCHIIMTFVIETELIYNVVLISAVQQSDSVKHIYSVFLFISRMVYHRALNIVPCAIQ